MFKKVASVLRAGYIEGWEKCIKCTKTPWYCCKHMKYLSFYNLSRLTFFKDISHGECWRYHFWASRFQNYLREDNPRFALSALGFNPPLSWKYTTPSLIISLCTDVPPPPEKIGRKDVVSSSDFSWGRGDVCTQATDHHHHLALDVSSTSSVLASLLIKCVAIVSVWCTYWSKCWIIDCQS